MKNFKKISSWLPLSFHYQLLSQFPNFAAHRSSSRSSGMVNGCRGFESIKDEGKKHGWRERKRGRRGSRIKPLCSKVSRTFSHGDSSRLITNSKASSPTGGETHSPVCLSRSYCHFYGPPFGVSAMKSANPLFFPSHRPQTCYCSSLIREPGHNNWSIS